MKSLLILWIFGGAAMSGCTRHSEELSPVRLIHDPPISRLTAQQLRSLSMECEKYTPNTSMRGRYDGAYCEAAIAAWADAPLQMIIVDKGTAAAPGAP